MTFTAYIERQKNIIKSRHEGVMFPVQKAEEIPLNDSEKILKDLSALRGLNTFERLSFRNMKR